MSALAFSVASCGGLATVHYPEVLIPEGKSVSVTYKHSNFLGFNPPKDTYEVLEDLSKKCAKDSNGKLSGVGYEVSMKNYILVLSTKIVVSGYCCCLEEGEEINERGGETEKKRKR